MRLRKRLLGRGRGVMVCVFGLLVSACVVWTTVGQGSDAEAQELTSLQSKIYSENNIVFYDPNDTGISGSGCVDGTVSVYGETAAEKIWVGLTSFLTDEQAAGVMGNMQYESGLNPARHNDSAKRNYPGFDIGSNSNVTYAIGLIQWAKGRRVGLINYIKEQDSSLMTYLEDYNTYSRDGSSGDDFISLAGDDVANRLISLEIEYLKDELESNSTYSGIFDQTTVADAAEYFLKKIEVPGNVESKVNERTQAAENYYNQFHDADISGSDSCLTGDVGSLIKYVLAYAWPEYQGKGHTTLKPDYAEAVAKRQKEGKYVGGSSYKGVDCGGFVTTLMQESGFEPNYNSENGGGNTKAQEAWVKEHWTKLDTCDSTELQPGDVAFTEGHTWVYVGKIDGFGSEIASASLDSRAPMAGREDSCAKGARWYRKK